MKKFLKKIELALLISFPIFGSSVSRAFAVTTTPGTPAEMCELTSIIANLFNWVMAFMPFGGLGVLIYGAFLWATSGADPQKLEQAKKTLTYGVLGLILGISSILIIATVETFLFKDSFSLYENGLLNVDFCIADYQP